MAEANENKKMMRLTTFCKEYDMPRNTVLDLVHGKEFPAYKIGARWYVDITKFEKWRVKEHQISYKYA